jgi:uncharacterized membrane protein
MAQCMDNQTTTSCVAKESGTVHRFAAAVLGFALGGFFDGILLHQVLQWHHFLSLADGKPYQDLQFQILADGLFHVAVYVIALFGLILLWRGGQQRPADRVVLAWAVLGFSVWQFVDVVLVHWVIGIHRVRVGVPNPLIWDIGWLAAFGLTTLLLGLWILRTVGPGARAAGRTVTALSAIVILGGAAAYPGSSSSSVPVLFMPTMTAQQTFAAAASVGANIIWSDPTGRLLVLDLPPGANSWSLYRGGAMLVGNTSAAGCLAVVRT